MSPVNVSAIGAYIREQREQAKISLRQLAQAAGISNPYLSQIERGLRRPSADILQQIAKGLRISAEALYVQAGLPRGPAAGLGCARGRADRPGAHRAAEADADRDLRVVPQGDAMARAGQASSRRSDRAGRGRGRPGLAADRARPRPVTARARRALTASARAGTRTRGRRSGPRRRAAADEDGSRSRPAWSVPPTRPGGQCRPETSPAGAPIRSRRPGPGSVTPWFSHPGRDSRRRLLLLGARDRGASWSRPGHSSTRIRHPAARSPRPASRPSRSG